MGSDSGSSTSISILALVIAIIAISIVVYYIIKHEKDTNNESSIPGGVIIADEIGGLFIPCPENKLCMENIDYYYSSSQNTIYGEPYTMNNNTGGRYYYTDPNCAPELIGNDAYDGNGCHAHEGDPLSRYCGGEDSPPCPVYGITVLDNPDIVFQNDNSISAARSDLFLTGSNINDCEACPAPNICQVSPTNPQTYNYDFECIKNGGGVGCNWQSKMGCRLCWNPDDPNRPINTPYLDCVQNPDINIPTPECTSDSQCNQGFNCVNGICVKSTCQVPSDCGNTSIWDCISGNCRKKCCSSNTDCPDSGTHCENKVCRLDTEPNITLTFKNDSDKTILLGANGPSPILPYSSPDPLNPWNLPPGSSIAIEVPDLWKQTSQAAQCNASVSGPRFWARTGCNIGTPYWAVVLPRIDIEPPIALSLNNPIEGESTVGDGVKPGTYKLGTKWVNTVTGDIFYKSYGDVWTKTYTKFTSGDDIPLVDSGSLGDIYRRNQYIDVNGNLQDYTYYMKTRKAQCDTGDCSNQYDCSYNNIAGTAGTSLAEFCFVCGDLKTYYDVSLVDGYNLSIDIKPVGGVPNPSDPFSDVTRLCEPGIDLRTLGSTYEGKAAGKFFLRAGDSPSSIVGNTNDPNRILSVFSNCGFYEYPTAPNGNCDPTKDERCRLWRQFCCQSNKYGQPCTSDAQCDNGGACWNGVCNCRAYYTCGQQDPPPPSTPIDDNNSVPNPIPGRPRLWKEEYVCCPDNTCFMSRDTAAQPIQGSCSIENGECIGDNTIHDYCHKAYTWPNDPTTFNSTATNYIITFSPGGTDYSNVRGTDIIPLCSNLDPTYYYDANTAKANCPADLATLYTCAIKKKPSDPSPPPWPCTVNAPGNSCQGVGTLCRWQ